MDKKTDKVPIIILLPRRYLRPGKGVLIKGKTIL
jgi:hypothetical protein